MDASIIFAFFSDLNYMFIRFFFLTGVMNTKTQDRRQCTLCQQYGDYAPNVSLFEVATSYKYIDY